MTRSAKGRKYGDETVDKDGEYGAGDTLMPKEKVYLYRVSDDGKPEDKPFAETTTDDKGFYSFDGLEPGHYAVLFGVKLDELAVTSRKDTDNGSKIDASAAYKARLELRL